MSALACAVFSPSTDHLIKKRETESKKQGARHTFYHPYPRAFCTIPSFARIKKPRWSPIELNGSYQSHASSNDFFPFRKLRFGGCQSNVSMTITASGVSRTTTESISMSVSQSIRVALSSLLDSSINRN